MLILVNIQKLRSEPLLSLYAARYCHDPHREARQSLKSITKEEEEENLNLEVVWRRHYKLGKSKFSMEN